MTDRGVALDATALFAALGARTLPAVVDDPAVGRLLADRGFEILPADAFEFGARSPVLFVPRHFATHDALFEAWDEAPGVRVHYSVARHRTDPRYAIEQLLGLDGPATLIRRRALWARIDDSARVEIATDGGRLVCHFGDAVEAANPSERIEPAGHDAVGDFTEAAVVNIDAPTSSFRAEGTLCFDGLAWLCNDDRLEAATADLRGEWLARAARGPNRARFDGGRLVELTLGGQSASAALQSLTADKERGSMANELGFGAAIGSAPVDPRQNARLHRGRAAAFIGIGAGHLIPHIDLWTARAELTWHR